MERHDAHESHPLGSLVRADPSRRESTAASKGDGPGDISRPGALDPSGASLAGESVSGCMRAITASDPIDEPWLLTLAQASAVVNVARTLSYELVALFEATGGVWGIPVVRVGGILRVPRAALAEQVRLNRLGRPAASHTDERAPLQRRG